MLHSVSGIVCARVQKTKRGRIRWESAPSRSLVAIRSRVRVSSCPVSSRTVSANNEFKVQQTQGCVKFSGFAFDVCYELDHKSLHKLWSIWHNKKDDSPPPRCPQLFLFHDAHQYLTDLFCAQLPFLGSSTTKILGKHHCQSLVSTSPITSLSARTRSRRRSGFIRNFRIPNSRAFSSVMV